MPKLHACQCGGAARYYSVKRRANGVRFRRPTERLACPACGNATGASNSREELTREWNLSGWCGIGERVGIDRSKGGAS